MNVLDETLCPSPVDNMHEQPYAGCAGVAENTRPKIQDNNALVNWVASQWDSQLRRHFQRNLRAKHQADVDDLMQDLYCRLFTCRNSSSIEAIKPFAFTIAQNLLRDRSRRVSTLMQDKSAPIDEVAEPYSETTCPERIVESGEALTQVMSVIDEWPPARREAFVQHRLCGESHKMVASRLGISVSMVEKHIASGSSALKQYRQIV